MADKVEKGTTTKDKGVFIPIADRAPDRPEYLHMSKKDAGIAEEKRKADEVKVKAYKKNLAAEKPEAPKEETKPESKVAEAAKKKAKAAEEKRKAIKAKIDKE